MRLKLSYLNIGKPKVNGNSRAFDIPDFKTLHGWIVPTRAAAVTGTCIFSDATTFINKDCRVLFGDISIVPLSSLGIFDSNVQPGVGKFGSIWLKWFARGQGIWWQIFQKCQIPTPCPASPPPRRLNIDRCISFKCVDWIQSYYLVFLSILILTLLGVAKL